jgi:hypothetical protein
MKLKGNSNTEVEVTINRAFYIRSHYTARPFSELFRIFIVDKGGAQAGKQIVGQQFFDLLLEFSQNWKSKMNDLGKNDIFWVLRSLNSQKVAYSKAHEYLKTDIVPGVDFFAWGKFILLDGISSGCTIFRLNEQLAKLHDKGVLVSVPTMRIKASRVSFWDWNAGMISLTVTVNLADFSGLDSAIKDSLLEILDRFYFSGKSEKGESTLNVIAKQLFDTCHMLFGQPSTKYVPAKVDNLYGKEFMDYGFFCVLRTGEGSKGEDESEAALNPCYELNKFVSDANTSDLPTEKNADFDYLVSGFAGLAIIPSSELSVQAASSVVARTKLIWEISLFYYSGLSKLKSRLLLLVLRIARTSRLSDLKAIPEIRRFPEFHLRASSFMNEAIIANIADQVGDRKVFNSCWKGLGGDDLRQIVESQLAQISQYVGERQNKEREKLSVRLEVKVAFIAILFTIFSVLEGGGDYFWDKEVMSCWFDRNPIFQLGIPILFIALPIIVFGVHFAHADPPVSVYADPPFGRVDLTV